MANEKVESINLSQGMKFVRWCRFYCPNFTDGCEKRQQFQRGTTWLQLLINCPILKKLEKRYEAL